MRLAFLCGLAAEAQLLKAEGLIAAATGGHGETCRRHLAEWRASGIWGIVSFGIAGALDPALKSGDLVLGKAVSIAGDPAPALAADPDLCRRLAAALPVAKAGTVIGSDIIVDRAEDKARLFQDRGAIAVDQESHWAARSGLPFVVLRAIADPANQSLPGAVLNALDNQGEAEAGAVIARLLRHPSQVPAVARAAMQSRRALKRLALAMPAITRALESAQ